MATETDLLYLIVLIVFTLIVHMVLSRKGPRRHNRRSRA
jgi:hypothetical protein